MKLIRVIKSRMEENDLRWGPIVREDIAEDVAKNFEQITGIKDLSILFSKSDETGINVNAELFDKQLQKIYKWVKTKYCLDKDTYDYMRYDSDFVDSLAEWILHFTDTDKIK